MEYKSHRVFDPPCGNVEKFSKSKNDCYIRWAPGNGVSYEVIVSGLSEDVADDVGGDHMVSVRGISGGYVSYPIVYGSIVHLSFFVEKFGGHLSDDGVYYYTALLNWVLYRYDAALQYGMECYQYAKDRWE